MTKDEIKQSFQNVFGVNNRDISCFFAPGRVNIIGEHQDYNGGHVFPAALTVGIYGAMRTRDDKTVRLYSANMKTLVEVQRDEIVEYSREWDWANYPLGIIHYLCRDGHDLPGFDIYFEGNLPAGAGLSSSACILDLTGYMLWSYLGMIPIDRTKLAEMAQSVEYNFIGVKVGIMDQFAISQGKRDHGVLLDCYTMNFELVPLTWDGYELIIMNTNKQRGLVDSKFNERKEECDQAFEIISQHRAIGALSLGEECDLAYIEDSVLRRRARHAITENKRVTAFHDALLRQDIPEVAALLQASHKSLKYDYEVSGEELDTIVEIAEQQPGCIAARMTGAGFGGCAIALVKAEAVDTFMNTLPNLYEKKIGTIPSLYKATIGDGVHQML